MALTPEQIRRRDEQRRAEGLPPGPEPAASDSVDLFVRADWRSAQDGDTLVWDEPARTWVPAQGAGSLLFGQSSPSLTASMPWRAPGTARLVRATLTVASAVDGPVDLVEVLVNGSTVASLSLDDGETTSTVAIDVAIAPGDRVAITRLATDGGACQVQVDRGA